MDAQLRQAALDFHEFPTPGKIEVTPTKSLATQRDLALAYSPGVAVPCLEIQADPAASYRYTSRGNLVAVISNGTAVLGLGNIGALAGKPVMEGKGVLFKKFAGVNVFDIEIDERDPDKLVDIIASLEPTFGGINLEDIKAPECFYIEQKLRERMKIPVFHDDQHGTAIISAAAILNGLRIVKKDIAKVKLIASGAGAASIACLNLLVSLGLPRENIIVCDSKGVIFHGRDERMDETKKLYAIEDNGKRTLAEVINDADIFLGCSAAGTLTQDMVKTMAANPLILALANPDPEILPPLAKAVRPDAIVCTGRSDYPNQVNNVLCFPFIFRGALDVSATAINEEMKLAAVHAIADLALAEQSEVVTSAYGETELSFGPEYLIPKPFDPRLIVKIAPAVAKAAMDSGVATRPIKDFDAYIEKLTQFVYKTNLFMKPVFAQAKQNKKRVLLTDGEESRVLHAVQEIATLGIATPILLGRPSVIAQKIKQLGLHIQEGRDFELVDIENNPYFEECYKTYHNLLKRKGITPAGAQRKMLHNPTVIGATLLQLGKADAMLCGLVGPYASHLSNIKEVIGVQPCVPTPATVNGLVLPTGNLFITDTFVNHNPTAQELAEITIMAANEVSRFGIEPKVALVSHSNFGTFDDPSAVKMREVLRLVKEKAPDLIIDGEMHCDVALNEKLRQDIMPDSPLKGAANLLVMPNMEAARISLNLLQGTATPITVGPILMGMNKPVHILTSASSVRRIINMVAIAAANVEPTCK
ncbi:malate dehydrogenase (oxaloacetate-decarboxylating)(NADP+) [Pasteurella multocida]|uniref:NADP-dependent malic enzyme n=1 Tax=Pasteurella TaxID=745 RepID=UPI0002145042|nr:MULTISPECIES: NADP-dependent malic enzyme [Pasteurella]EGP05538.1 bifunctional malic enzyme oxidoreductase/phosphotransacetylase [Pasteurella multocida subsp. multocida str. Anand1_goat]AKD40035.1 bifunctional malic enzyme oxidoreductase/phosphotransacetylase [Pasteurella multocida OH1905]AMM82111.1 malic enzyme [Pasteurella multocida subsp. multocida PMTB2.1]APW56837.1 NADP-dependent malic enzyme [Pasteurella multocida]ARB75892.1 NADP-dependent malic enzyme [Pasteurella multocida]